MSIQLFDVQTGFGLPPQGQTEAVTVEDCRAYMARLNIARALVCTYPDALSVDMIMSRLLFGACSEEESLAPCPEGEGRVRVLCMSFIGLRHVSSAPV